MSEADDKVNREKRQETADRAKKKRNGNDEGDSGRKEEDAVAPSSVKRGCGIGSGGNSNNVGSKRSQAIAKSRRGKISSDRKNGSKQNIVSRILQAKGQVGWPRWKKQAAHTETPWTMMLEYWEALMETVRPEFCIPPCCQGPLRELHNHPLQEGTGITTGTISMQRMATRKLLPLPRLTTTTRILVVSKL